jgi:hypothetical protein
VNRLKVLLAVVTIAVAASLTGCTSTTQYEVLDRFHRVDATDPNKEYFLWLKKGDEKAFDHYFPANQKSIWDSCWPGDNFFDRKVGEDYCERTEKSEMPTTLKQAQ